MARSELVIISAGSIAIGDAILGAAPNSVLITDGSSNLDFTTPAVAGTFLQWNGAAFVWAASTASMVIGNAVTSGTDPAILYIDGGLLAQDPTNFYYDPTVEFLVNVDSGTSSGAFRVNPSLIRSQLFDTVANAIGRLDVSPTGINILAQDFTTSFGASFAVDNTTPIIQGIVTNGVASTGFVQNPDSTVISSLQQSLVLTNDDDGYTPVGPLPFAGAYQTTGIPTVSYSGLRSAGGLGQPVMEVRNPISGVFSRILANQSEITIDAVIDPGSNNSTSGVFSNGGSPVIAFTANSGTKQISDTLDASQPKATRSVTNGTFIATSIQDGANALSSMTGNNGAGRIVEASMNAGSGQGTITATDGTATASLTIDGTSGTQASMASSDGVLYSTTVTANGVTGVVTNIATDGTGTATISVDGANYAVLISATDSTNTSAMFVDGSGATAGISVDNGGANSVTSDLDAIAITFINDAQDGTGFARTTLDGSAYTSTTATSDGTNNTTHTLDGGATPSAVTSVTDGTGLVEHAMNLISFDQQMTASNGTSQVSLTMQGDATPTFVSLVDDNTNSSTFTQTPTGFAMTDDLTVPDEAFGSGWNGSLEVPTKNAIFDIFGDGTPSNIYSPTASAPSNLDSTPTATGRYMRIGNTVVVSGTFLANPTAGGNTSFELSLPFASNFSTSDQAAGMFTINGAIAVWEGGSILAEPTNNTLKFEWEATNTVGQTYTWQVMYQII